MRSSHLSDLAPQLALEGLVIVASILAAFALDTWADTRAEHEAEHLVLVSLREEFTVARDQLDEYIGFHRRIGAAAGGALEMVRAGLDEGRASVDVPDTVIALAYVPPTFDPKLGTLDGLLAVGRLGLLRDHELRRALAGWAGMLAEGTEEEQKGLRHVFDQLDPVLRTRMDVSRPLELMEAIAADTLAAEQAARTSPLRIDPEVAGVFALRKEIQVHGIDDLDDVLAEIDRVLVLIDRSLGVETPAPSVR